MGLQKCVFVQPSSIALAFIRSANAFTLPLTCSASPFATSLADFKSSAYRQSLTVSTSPSDTPAVTAPDSRFDTASYEKLTCSSREQCSYTSIAVMSFVMDAGYIGVSSDLPYITVPVAASIRTAAPEFISGPASAVSVCATSARAVVGNAVSAMHTASATAVIFSLYLIIPGLLPLCRVLCPERPYARRSVRYIIPLSPDIRPSVTRADIP